MEKFSEYLKLLLQRSGKTKAHLARALKLKRQNYIGNILSGLHTPTLLRVKQIAATLACANNEKEKLLYLASIERGLKKRRINILHPKIRKVLLKRYFEDFGENCASKSEIKEILEQSPFHPFESKILEKVFSRLIEIGLAKPNENYHSFFQSLSEEDLAEAIDESGLEWGYSKKIGSILISIRKAPGKSVTTMHKLTWSEELRKR